MTAIHPINKIIEGLLDTNIQDWPEAARLELRDYVLELYGNPDYDRVCAVGSRVMGFPRFGDDIDCIIYIDGYEFRRDSRIAKEQQTPEYRIEGTRLSLSQLNMKLPMTVGKALLPKADLETGRLIDFDPVTSAVEINRWLDDRILKDPDFMDGRDLKNLIVERIT